MLGPLLDIQMLFRVAGARDCAPGQKWAKREGFVACPKTMAGVGHLNRIWKDACRRQVHYTIFVRDVRRSGRWFPEKGCILEPEICRFAEVILHDRCSTPYDLASLFPGRRSTSDRWTGKIAKRMGTRPSGSALNFPFLKDVSQNCFVFDVVNFEKRKSQLLRFWRYQVRRIASFLMLSTLKNEDVSQNCFVFDVVKFKHWGRLAELLRFWCC